MKVSDFSWCGAKPDQSVFERASKIKLILMDVDGILTDGRIYYVPDHNGGFFETKGFNSLDGLGFHFLSVIGIKTGFISGRQSQAVAEYARNKNVDFLYQGNIAKKPIWQEILQKSQLQAREIAYIGDDFSDLPLLKQAGLACTVGNARAEVKEIAHFITQAIGGDAAVREIIELILKARGDWQKILDHFSA